MQVLVLGQPGEEVSLELILRVVADVGLVVSIALYLFMHVFILASHAYEFWSNDIQHLMMSVYDKKVIGLVSSTCSTKNWQSD